MNATPMLPASLPSAPDIERAVIGALLFDPEYIPALLAAGGSGLFYRPAHQVIVRAIDALHTEGVAPDQLTLTEKLRCDGVLEDIGGEAAIASFIGEITSVSNIPHHIDVLSERAARRKLAMLSVRTIERACDCSFTSA